MAKIKYDAVLQAVHYKPNGEVDWVRTFQRRGPIFSDRVVLDRQQLVNEIKSGKKYVIGNRIPFMAGAFEVSKPVRLIQNNGDEIIVAGDIKSDRDRLNGVPVI